MNVFYNKSFYNDVMCFFIFIFSLLFVSVIYFKVVKYLKSTTFRVVSGNKLEQDDVGYVQKYNTAKINNSN